MVNRDDSRGAVGGVETRAMEAICSDCGLIFPSRAGSPMNMVPVVIGYSDTGLRTEHPASSMEVTGEEPCPRCGGRAVVNELYGVIEEGVVRMTGTGVTAEQVSAIFEILRAAIARRETRSAAVADEIRLKLPDEKWLPDWISKYGPRGDKFIEFITLLVAVLGLWLSRHPPHVPAEAIVPAAPAAASPAPAQSAPSSEDIRSIVREAIKAEQLAQQAARERKEKNRRKELRKKHQR